MKNFIVNNQDTDNIDKIFSNRGFAYGDGFFSTMGVYQGSILWFEYHIKRLISHSKALNFDLDLDDSIKKIKLMAQQLDEGMLKLVIVRKKQNVRGYSFNSGEVEVLIQAKSMKMPAYHKLNCLQVSYQTINQTYPDKIPTQPLGIAVQLSNKISCLPQHLVGIKSLNRLDNVLLAGELEIIKSRFVAQDMDNKNKMSIVEGLVSDVADSFFQKTSWVEGVMSNVFYQLKSTNHSKSANQKKQWYTPPIDVSGVNGVMRQVIMDKLEAENRAVIERRLTDQDMCQISAMFFCNSVKGIIPIDSLYLLTGEKLNFLYDGV